jgi:hypothetical protein
MVKSQEQISREQMTHLQRKLDTCRNPENNPESEVYVFIYREQKKEKERERNREKKERDTSAFRS